MLVHGLEIPEQCEKCPLIEPDLKAYEFAAKAHDERLTEVIAEELGRLIVADCPGAEPDSHRLDFVYCGSNEYRWRNA